MKTFIVIFGLVSSLVLTPLFANGQGPIYLGTPFNQDYNDGDIVYYPNCSYSRSTLTAHLNNGGSQVNPTTPTGLPGGWSASIPGGSNQVNYSISFGQDGDLVQPYSYPNGGGSQYTLHFRNPIQPSATFTSVPALGASQTGTVTITGSGAYTYAYWYVYGQLTVNSYNTTSASVSTGSYGGLLEVTLDNQLGCPYATTAVAVGTPFIDYTTVNGSNGTMATVPYVATLALFTLGTATGANWSITNGSGSISTSGTSCNAYPSNFLRVVGTATNSNGSGQDATFYIWLDGYSGYRMAYPNPAKDKVTLEFDDALMAKELLNELSLLDEKGKVWQKFNLNEAKASNYFEQNKSVTFNVKDLPRGTYFLHIKLGEKLKSERIVIE